MNNNSLSAALQAVHNEMINEFQSNQDVAIAERLEVFFNKVIYNKNTFVNFSSNENIGIILDKYLTDDLANRIRRSLKIKEKPKFTWQQFETTVGDITQKIVNNIFETRSTLKSAQAGTGQNYVPNLQEIPDDYKDEILKELSFVQDGDISRTWARMGKNDVFIQTKLRSDMESDYALLQNLSFSLKNYSGTLKLEAVNPLKAYLAIMQNYQKYIKTNENLAVLYADYYLKKVVPDDPEVTLHLNHLINVYALSGLGNYDLNTGKSVGGTRFLVTNTGSTIRVYSTAAIIRDLLGGGDNSIISPNTYLFGARKQRKSRHRMITIKINK